MYPHEWAECILLLTASVAGSQVDIVLVNTSQEEFFALGFATWGPTKIRITSLTQLSAESYDLIRDNVATPAMIFIENGEIV